MIMPMRPNTSFDPEAKRRWENLPQLEQEAILANVWCVHCLVPVEMMLESIEMIQMDLILNGRCKTCGQSVCRVVESET